MSNLFSNTPTIYNITLTVLDTEYSQLLPDGTQKIKFQCRTSNVIRYAFEIGKVAAPTSPYYTLKADDKSDDKYLYLEDNTIYFASSTAGVIVEMLVWK